MKKIIIILVLFKYRALKYYYLFLIVKNTKHCFYFSFKFFKTLYYNALNGINLQ